MDVDIRPAGPHDIAAVVAFGAEVLPVHYAPIIGAEAARDQLRWWTPELTRAAVDDGRMWLAFDAGTLVGVCQTGEHDGEHVVWKLYVAPAARGRAVGAALLERAVAALPAGTERVLLEHFAGNTRAAAFYEREGFTVLRTEPAAFGDPAAAVVWRQRDRAPRSRTADRAPLRP